MILSAACSILLSSSIRLKRCQSFCLHMWSRHNVVHLLSSCLHLVHGALRHLSSGLTSGYTETCSHRQSRIGMEFYQLTETFYQRGKWGNWTRTNQMKQTEHRQSLEDNFCHNSLTLLLWWTENKRNHPLFIHSLQFWYAVFVEF